MAPSPLVPPSRPAHAITSRDRHLLSLRDATTPAGKEFMSRFGFVEVLTPKELLNRLGSK